MKDVFHVYSSVLDVRCGADGPALFLSSFGLLEIPCTDTVQMEISIR